MGSAMRKAFFNGFEKKYGIRVVETSPADFGKLRAMVESGNVEWDVTEIGGQDAIRATEMKLVEKIDDKIVDRSKYPEKARTPYVFASSVYTTIIGYRTDVFKNGTQPKSWADWWDVKKFPGARSMRDHPTDNLEFALIADGVPMDKIYPIDFDRAFKKLDQIKPHVNVWWATGQQPAQLLLDKEVVLATGWNGRFYDLIKKGGPIEIEWNQGALKQGSFVIPRGAKNAVLGPEDAGRDVGAAAAGDLCQRARLSRPQSRGAELRRRQGEALPADRSTSTSSSGSTMPGTPRTATRRWSCGTPGSSRRRKRVASRSADLKVEGLVKRFGEVVALDGVSLDIASGELLTILGPSGSGKTTLLKVVAGFETPDAGPVKVDGVDITAMPPAKRDIGMVFQNYALFPHLTVARNVAFPLEMRNVGKRRDRAPGRRGARAGRARRATASACRASSRAASSSAWRSPAPSSSTRGCCCSTSRSARSTASCARPCSSRCAACSAGSASPRIFITHDQEEALVLSDRIAVMNKGAIAAGRLDRPRSTSGRPTISSPTSWARATSSTAP